MPYVPISLEEGWALVQKGIITKIEDILEGRALCDLFAQKPPHDYRELLCCQYLESISIEEYLTSEVVPPLHAKTFMLSEVLRRWSNLKAMVWWLSRFGPVDRSLEAGRVGFFCFRELIYEKFKAQIKDRAIALMHAQSEGRKIDSARSAVLKDILDIFVEMRRYKQDDFEDSFLQYAESYYTSKSENWIAGISSSDSSMIKKADSSSSYVDNIQADLYMIKVEYVTKRLKKEIDRCYLFKNTEQQFLEVWALVQKGIITKLEDILEGRPVPPMPSEEFTMLYTAIYNLCAQKSPHDYWTQLCYKSRESFEEYLTSKVLPSLHAKNGEFMLREVVQRWSNLKVMVRWLSRLCGPVDPSLEAGRVGFFCFRELVKQQMYEKFKAQIKDAVIALMHEQSEGRKIDSALLKDILDIFVEMKRYKDDFEDSFLQYAESYYTSKSENWIAEISSSDLSMIKKAESSSSYVDNIQADLYMIKVEDYMKRQKEIDRNYLFKNTEQQFFEIIQFKLVEQHANRLLENEHSGCFALVRDDKVDDLCRMFRLFSKDNYALEHFSNLFETHVKNAGTALVKQAEDSARNKKPEKRDMVDVHEEVFVWNIIKLHQKYVAYVNKCFLRHTLFLKALKQAFGVLCNKGLSGISSAQIFSTFCDNYLKKDCSAKLSDEEIEDAFQQVVRLLVYIRDKDLFARFYRYNLARRLLFDKTASDKHERSILIKLKQQFGRRFTSNMEGMVADLGLASDRQTEFKEFISSNPDTNPGIDLAVTVLTTGFWPSYTSFDMKNVPAEMEKCVEIFNAFYQTRTKNRKLTWIYSLGTCNIEAKFEAKPIELIVAPCQAALLLLFNRFDRLSYCEIVEELNLSDADDVVPLLHSVSCGKYMILNKEPANKCISPKDVFEFNSKFTDRMRRIKVPLPRADDKEKVFEDEVHKDRKYAIDASIVRIMKSRKVMGHAQLVRECVEQLNRMFKPDVKAIKKQIDSLMQRDYLERDEHNANIYRYLA